MKLRYKILPFALTIIALCVGYVITNPLDFGLCQKIYTAANHFGCLDDSIRFIGEPLVAFTILTIPATLILIFTSSKIFSTWLKFAVIWILLTIYFVSQKIDTGYQTFQVIQLNSEIIATYMGWAFLIISLLLISWKSFRKPKPVQK